MITNTNLEIMNVQDVRGYTGENGVVYLNLEDISRKLGFTQRTRNGNEIVRWERVEKYLIVLNFIAPTNGCTENQGNISDRLPEYIPENMVYRLAMKANNQLANSFQEKLANEIIPMIRRTKMYMAKSLWDRLISHPSELGKVFTEYGRQIEELTKANNDLQEKNDELEYEVDDLTYDLEMEIQYVVYLENALNGFMTKSSGTYSMGEFSKLVQLADSNGNIMGRNKLFQVLRKEKYLMNGGNRNTPYQKYINKGYFKLFCKSIGDRNIVIVRITEKGKGKIAIELQEKGYTIINKSR